MSGPVREVLVVGGGVEAATVANALCRALPKAVRVRLLRASDDPVIPAVVASHASIRRFHADFAIDELSLVREKIACFSLGTAASGWTADGGASFAPFGDVGATIEGVAFHQHAARLRAAGHQLRPTDYSVATLMAQAGRFVHPANDPASPLSTYSYALHLQRDLYAAHLLALALQHGLGLMPDSFDRLDSDTGDIVRVVTNRGEAIDADLIIDATGSRRGIISQTPGAKWQCWARLFPARQLLIWQEANQAAPAPYDHLARDGAGWQRTIPGPQSVAQVLAFAGDHAGADEGANPSDEAGQATRITFAPGREAEAWRGNVVAVGGAAGLFDPAAGSYLQLLQEQVRRLLRFFPVGADMAVERREYSRETGAELDRARDVAQLRFVLAGQSHEPSSELAAKLDLFRSCGRVPLLDGDQLTEAEWATLFEGLGVCQQRHNALADAVPVDRLTAMLARMREAIIRSITPLPRHGDYLVGLSGKAAA